MQIEKCPQNNFLLTLDGFSRQKMKICKIKYEKKTVEKMKMKSEMERKRERNLSCIL